MNIKVNSIGIAYSKSIKLGEGLIAVGSVLTITGLLILRSNSQWCILNNINAIDETIEFYNHHK